MIEPHSRELPRSPSMLRVTWLVIAFAIRRLANRINARRRAGRKPGARGATARKKPMGAGVLILLSFILLWNCVARTTQVVRQVAERAELRDADHGGQIIVSDDVIRIMALAEGPVSTPAGESIREILDGHFVRLAEQRAGSNVSERTRLLTDMRRRFDEEGRRAFRTASVPRFAFLPGTELWFGASGSSAMLVPLGLVALLLCASTVLAGVAGATQDLSRIEWSLEWWFTFPVPARGLLLARALEAAFANPLAWLLILPFFEVVFWCAGLGWLGIPLGFLAMVCVGLLSGGVRVLAEAGLRKWLSLRNVARVQALLSVLASLSLMLVVLMTIPEFLDRLLVFSDRLPQQVFVNAFTPIRLAAGGAALVQTALACTAFAALFTLGATTVGGYWLRDGLTTGGGENQGSRGRRGGSPVARGSGSGSGFGLGVVALNELRSVFRNRTRFMQTFVTPVLLLAMQLLANRGLFEKLGAHPQHAAAIAFGAAALMLSSGGCNSLTAETPALWLYFTVPRPLDRLMVEKAYFWAALASVVALAVFFTLAWRTPGLAWAAAPSLVLGLVGVVIYAFVATALGALGTNALETEPTRRVQVTMVYLFMLLASLFAYALYAPSWWSKLAQVVLSGLLAFALLQKVRDRAPYLLDPNAEPPPTVAVADGVIAALIFFVTQGLLVLAFRAADCAPGASLLFAFAGAGVLATVSTLLGFWSARLPKLLDTLGFRAPAQGWPRAVLSGLFGGLAASAIAMGYLFIVQRVPFLRHVRDETVTLLGSDPSSRPWFAALAIVAAPLFEEFVFRGVLFCGFRRSLGAFRGALASAAVFAIVHPPIAAAPVFVLGVVAALAYDRSRCLATPVLAHATYNAVVFLVGSRG